MKDRANGADRKLLCTRSCGRPGSRGMQTQQRRNVVATGDPELARPCITGLLVWSCCRPSLACQCHQPLCSTRWLAALFLPSVTRELSQLSLKRLLVPNNFNQDVERRESALCSEDGCWSLMTSARPLRAGSQLSLKTAARPLPTSARPLRAGSQGVSFL